MYPVGSGKANVALISCSAGNPKPRLNPSSPLHQSTAHTFLWHASWIPRLGQGTYPSTMLQSACSPKTLCKRKTLTSSRKEASQAKRPQGRPRDTPKTLHAPLHGGTQPYVNYCDRRPQQGNNWIPGRLTIPSLSTLSPFDKNDNNEKSEKKTKRKSKGNTAAISDASLRVLIESSLLS